MVLQRVYDALGGANWLNSDGWTPGQSCDTIHQDRWHGTVCAGGSIHRLELVANGLQNTLPTEIGALAALKALAIESNPLLSGTIPTELGALASLRSLSIHNNTRISGTLPSQLGLLSNLRFLSVHSSSLSGTLPSSLVLSRLNYFDAASNSIGGHMPAFEQAGSLQYLSLHHNQLSGTLSSGVGMLSGLRDRIHANANRISGTLPSELGNLTHLALPALQENSITGTVPTQLGRITQLIFPSLSYNLLSGTVPTELASWTSLQGRLDLASNLLTTYGEQASIDSDIVRRGQSAAVPTSWYAYLDRCNWRRQPAGRSQCSASDSPDVAPRVTHSYYTS